MSLACCRDGCRQESLEYLVKHGPDGGKLSRSPSWITRSMGDIYTAGQNGDDVAELHKVLADLGFE
jgi:hypothetical protein